MGPVMNLLLAVVLTAVVLYQGAEKCRRTRISRSSSASSTAGSPAAKADIQPRRSHRDGRGPRRRHVGAVLHRGRHAAEPRSRRSACCATASSMTRKVTPTSPAGRAGSRSATSACCPNVHPHVPTVDAGRAAAERAGLKAGDVVVAVDGAADHVRATQLQRRDREAPGAADHAVDPARRRAPDDLRSTPRQARRRRAGSASRIADETVSIKPGPVEAVAHERRRRTSSMPRLIFQTLWGLFTRETSPKQLMGPVAIAQLSGESAQLGWIALLQPDGVDQPEPRPAEPDADSGPRRRPHLHHGARRARAPRLQRAASRRRCCSPASCVLMMLMVTVIYNDLTRISWIERLMPWR